MKLNKIMSGMISALLIVSTSTLACTSLAITDTNKHVYHGRTLELAESLPSWITYYPQGMTFQKKTPDGKEGIKYSAKYAILAISTQIYDDGDDHNIFQGLNSGGLSFSANMMDEAVLYAPEEKNYDKAIPVTAIGEWALASFASVDEVREAVNSGTFWAPVLKNFGNLKSPFHYAFYDKNGGSIVVEAREGKLYVYDNPTRAMTNGPDFSWHLKNLNNYTQLTNVDRSTAKLGGIDVRQPDSGIATSDLPSSDTSVGRFIRAVYYSSYAPKAGSTEEAMNTLAHVMNRFDRTKNITVDTMGESAGKTAQLTSEYAVWTSLSDLSNGTMLVRGYKDINYSKFTLAQYKDSDKPVFEMINVGK